MRTRSTQRIHGKQKQVILDIGAVSAIEAQAKVEAARAAAVVRAHVQCGVSVVHQQLRLG